MILHTIPKFRTRFRRREYVLLTKMRNVTVHYKTAFSYLPRVPARKVKVQKASSVITGKILRTCRRSARREPVVDCRLNYKFYDQRFRILAREGANFASLGLFQYHKRARARCQIAIFIRKLIPVERRNISINVRTRCWRCARES